MTDRMLDKLLLDHPRDIGESYGEHAGHALRIGLLMLGGGVACLLHALLPGLFVKTASNAVQDIQSLMDIRMSEAATSSQSSSQRQPLRSQ